jgi:hypothetical protein
VHSGKDKRPDMWKIKHLFFVFKDCWDVNALIWVLIFFLLWLFKRNVHSQNLSCFDFNSLSLRTGIRRSNRFRTRTWIKYVDLVEMMKITKRINGLFE